MQRRTLLKLLHLRLCYGYGSLLQAYAADTIKVGITFALRDDGDFRNAAEDVALMAIDDINAKGGVLGRNWSRWWSTQPACRLPRRRASWPR